MYSDIHISLMQKGIWISGTLLAEEVGVPRGRFKR
jgi:hypothetical protein